MPPPVRRLPLEDAKAAHQVAPPAAGDVPVPGGPYEHRSTGTSRAPGGFTGARRSIGAPQFSIRRMEIDDVSVSYSNREAVKSVSLPVRQGEVLSMIGPSGCGKTTLLRSLNRLTELTSTATLRGRILLDDVDITQIEPTLLRRRVTMVFQQPNPFPMSVFDNIAYVLRE
ncbi:MAG TPA: ATP-binding cassette domain-containing protein, partial [Solirubrobacterales bacterium]